MAIARGWEQACGRSEDFMAGRVPMGKSFAVRDREFAAWVAHGIEAQRRDDLGAALCRAIGRMR